MINTAIPVIVKGNKTASMIGERSCISTDRGNPSTIRGNSSNNNNRGNPYDQESPVDFLDSTFTASADHSMSLKDITQPRSGHQVVHHKGHLTSNAILLYHDMRLAMHC